MFIFDNVMFAGTVIVRDQMESQNYAPSGGANGWALLSNGDAFLNNVSIRGVFSTGPAGTPHIIIDDSPLPPFGGIPRILLYSNDPQEISPAIISNFQNAGLSWFEIDTSDDGFGVNQMIGLAPQSLVDAGGWLFATTSAGSAIGLVVLDADMQFLSRNVNFLNALASTTHPWQIGLSSGFNLRADKQQLQAMNNGAASTLFLQRLGNDVQIGDTGTVSDLVMATGSVVSTEARHVSGADSATRTTTSLTYVVGTLTATATLPYPPSGLVTVAIQSWMSTAAAANTAFISFEIRDTNAAGTLRFAASDAAGAKVQGTSESSGSIVVPIAVPSSGTMFIRAMMKVDGGTGTFVRTRLTVIPSP